MAEASAKRRSWWRSQHRSRVRQGQAVRFKNHPEWWQKLPALMSVPLENHVARECILTDQLSKDSIQPSIYFLSTFLQPLGHKGLELIPAITGQNLNQAQQVASSAQGSQSSTRTFLCREQLFCYKTETAVLTTTLPIESISCGQTALDSKFRAKKSLRKYKMPMMWRILAHPSVFHVGCASLNPEGIKGPLPSHKRSNSVILKQRQIWAMLFTHQGGDHVVTAHPLPHSVASEYKRPLGKDL